MYRNHPSDLHASRLAAGLAHAATVIEFTFPVLLAVVFHLAVLSTVPMAVPIEWNVFFIYSGLVLFGTFSGVRFWALGDLLLTGLLVAALVVPVVGNRFADRVSFLASMRYDAGSWAFSMWLFRGDALDRLVGGITTVAADPVAQLSALYGLEPGDVRAIIVESQPAGVATLGWRIVDAATGRLDEGGVAASHLEEGQLWAT